MSRLERIVRPLSMRAGAGLVVGAGDEVARVRRRYGTHVPIAHIGNPLEAMACGLPVVATAVSGVQDILAGGGAEGGLIVAPGLPDALAAALARVVDDDALARVLGERARARVEDAFSLEAVGRRLPVDKKIQNPVTYALSDRV